MKSILKKAVLGISLIFNLSLAAQNDNVEVVIATGLDMSQACAFSPDNRLVAQALYNSISIWDVNTGRLIRVATYVDNITSISDTIWFTEDSKYVMVGITLSNDQYKMDVATGASELIKGEPFDYTNYTYKQSIRTQSSLHLHTGSKKSLSYPSPDGKAEIVYQVIDNPWGNSELMPHMFETRVKVNGQLSEPLDTTYQAGFAFSPDSRYVFCETAVIDLVNGKLASKLKIVPFSGYSIMFMPETHIPITAGVHSIRYWDFPDIDQIKAQNLVKFLPSYDGKMAVAETFDMSTGQKAYFKVDLENREISKKMVRTKETGYLLSISPDGSRYSFLEMIKKDPKTAQISYNVKICDAENGKVIKEIKSSTKAYFTADPNKILVDSLGMQNMILDLKSGKMTRFPEEEANAGRGAYQVSRDGKYLLGSTTTGWLENKVESEVFIWEFATGKIVFRVKEKGVNISGFDMSKDSKYVSFASSAGHRILIYNFETQEKIHSLEAHTALIQFTSFSDDGKRLLSSSLDGSRRMWNLEKGTEMVNLINTGSKDFAIVTPKNYYYATKGAKRLIHFVKGDQVYPFEQFDLKYNRPDIIIQSLEASNQGLVRPYYYAYQKRLKRLGFTEEMLDGEFHMPTAGIQNTDKIPLITENDIVKLKINAHDDLYDLDRLLVRVNEVPIHGKKGMSLREKNASDFATEIPIQLSNGRNFIEVSVMNEKGVESLSDHVVVNYDPGTVVKPNLYLYTIGVSDYQQSQFNLNFAAKDANDIYTLFGNQPPPFNKIFSKQYTNEQVTLESIQGIKEELKQTNVDDAVCVFFAGHGVLDVNLDYFLASYDIDFKDPAARGIPYEVLEDLLDEIPARKKLIMIDACHSGEIDKDEVALVEGDASSNESEEDISFRAVTSTSVKHVGLNNSFELMKELFNDIRKSSGTMIISSAGGMEYAMEGGDWNNGVFTYCFLNGLKNKEADLNNDGKIMLSEMSTYVHQKVFELTDGRQQPTTRAEVIDSDWRLW